MAAHTKTEYDPTTREVKLNVWVEPELKLGLVEVAELSGRSYGEEVRAALREYVYVERHKAADRRYAKNRSPRYRGAGA